MPNPVFQYQVYHPVTRGRLGQLTVREPSWTEVVNGGTTFTGKVTVPDNPLVVSQIDTCTKPYESSIYAIPAGTGAISFGGPVINRVWDDETNTITVTAIDWKSWCYRVIVGPKADGTNPFITTYTNMDQLAIARTIIYRVFSPGQAEGVPVVQVGDYVSGVNRTYQVSGTQFKTLGAWLDDLGGLANGGFEWEVEPVFSPEGIPVMRFQFYIPQRGGVIPGLLFSKTFKGGNILKIDSYEEDASAVARRVWAVGEGASTDSTPYAADTDPTLVLRRSALRTDTVTQYSGTLTRSQLASYARAERAYRSVVLGGLTFTVRLDSPDWTTYGKGDRCRIKVQDRFLNLDVRKCRILSRQINPDSNTAQLTVNLNDLKLPEVDSGGAV